MAAKMQHSLNEFRELVKGGKTKKEIMDKMGIKTPNTFTALKCKLYENDGKVYKIKGGKSVLNTVRMGKNGNIVLSKHLLDGSGFTTGDKFKIYITAKRITLNLTD